MSNQNPFLSIIIPAHNEAADIPAAIHSIRQQEIDTPTEIIVSCNGCSDSSAEIARSLDVIVIESDKSGMSFGKNLGGRHARGRVLLFLDADTRLLSGALKEIIETCYASLENEREIVGTVQAFLHNPTFWEQIVMWAVNRIQYQRKLPTPSGAIFISASTYAAIGGFNESIPQGTSSDLVMRALASKADWAFLWEAHATTSPRRFRKVGILRQLCEWVINVRLIRQKNAQALSTRTYENIR